MWVWVSLCMHNTLRCMLDFLTCVCVASDSDPFLVFINVLNSCVCTFVCGGEGARLS